MPLPPLVPTAVMVIASVVSGVQQRLGHDGALSIHADAEIARRMDLLPREFCRVAFSSTRPNRAQAEFWPHFAAFGATHGSKTHCKGQQVSCRAGPCKLDTIAALLCLETKFCGCASLYRWTAVQLSALNTRKICCRERKMRKIVSYWDSAYAASSAARDPCQVGAPVRKPCRTIAASSSVPWLALPVVRSSAFRIHTPSPVVGSYRRVPTPDQTPHTRAAFHQKCDAQSRG